MSEDARSVDQIEADIEASRKRLTANLDELKFRSQPKELARRQVASVKVKAKSVTHTEEGDLRVERVVAVAVAAALLVTAIVLLKRRD